MIFSYLFGLHFLSYKLLEVTFDDQSFYLFLRHEIPQYHDYGHDETDKTY